MRVLLRWSLPWSFRTWWCFYHSSCIPHKSTQLILHLMLKYCIGSGKSSSQGIQCWRKVTQVQKMLLFFPDYNHLVENTKSGFQRNHYYIIQKCYPLAYMALLSLSWSSGIANVLHRLWCKVETDSETPQRFLSSLPIDEAWCSCQWECPKVLSSSSAIDLCCLALQWSAYHWLLTNQ